LLVWPLHYV